MPLLGIFIELPTPEPVEMAGDAGFDFCVIDCEHGPIDNAMLPGMLRAARIPAYVRVPAGSAELIQGALDNGADGVIVPRLRSVEEAKRVVQAARFFPAGQRGVNHFVRAARYSLAAGEEFITRASQARVIVQIETAEALESVEAIAGVAGVDELFIGPYDLSQALGIPGQVLDPRLLQAGETVVRAAKTQGRAVSVFVNSEAAAERWITMGVDALHYSADTFLLAQGMLSVQRRLRELCGRSGGA